MQLTEKKITKYGKNVSKEKGIYINKNSYW